MKSRGLCKLNYLLHIIIMINIYIILSTSTNLLVGLTNLLSLGQAAFYGIGAYLTVYALMTLNFPLIPTLIFVFIFTAVSSLIIAYPSLKLKGDYFVLATLGFQLIVYAILYNWIAVTRGPYGIPGIPAPKLVGTFEISGIVPFLILSTILALITVYSFRRFIHSPFGRVLIALSEDEIFTQSLGKNVYKAKVISFTISAMFAAIPGVLYAHYISYIDPTSFTIDESIFILSIVIIGGMRNMWKIAGAAAFLVLLPEALRFLGMPNNIAANMRQIIYGAILIFVIFRSGKKSNLSMQIIK